MTYKTVYLFRHGETDWNAQKRLQGRTGDMPLNEKGLSQANTIASKFQGKIIKTIYSSPLKRAKQTAEVVANHLKADITYIDDLQERSFGILEGMSFDEITDKYPELQELISYSKNCDFVSEDGNTYGTESLKDTQARIYKTITDIIKKSIDDVVVISSHGSVLYNFLLHVLGHDDFDHIPNAEVLSLQFSLSDEKYTLQKQA